MAKGRSTKTKSNPPSKPPPKSGPVATAVAAPSSPTEREGLEAVALCESTPAPRAAAPVVQAAEPACYSEPPNNTSQATETEDARSIDRHSLIEQLAYRHAEARGLGKTNPLEDWLWAENEVERRLAQTG